MDNNEGTLKKAIHGGKWMFLNILFQQVFSLAYFPILARLLTPEYFGIMSLILIAPNILNLITLISFETALIQSKDDIKKYLNEAWTFNILRTIVLFLVVFFSAPLIANFFHIEKAILAIRLSGIFLIISGLSNVAQLYFFKDIDFKKIFIRDALGSVFYGAISISLAVFYKSFWPLFWGYFGQCLWGTIVTYLLHEYRPRLNFQFKKLKDLLDYSKWIFGQNIIINAIPMIENGLIGRIINATGVGLYSRAKSLAFLPSTPLYSIFEKVTYPAYAKIQDAYEKIKDGFIKSLDILFFLTIPFILLFIENGRRIIIIFLGEQWVGMDILLKILLLGVTVNTLNAISGPIFNATGKPKIQFYINFMNIITLIALFLIFAPIYGTVGVAIAVLINSIIILTISFYKLIKILGIKIIEIINPIIIPLFSSILSLILMRTSLKFFGDINSINFLILITFAGIFYCAIIFFFGKIFRKGPYKTLKLISFEIINKKI